MTQPPPPLAASLRDAPVAPHPCVPACPQHAHRRPPIHTAALRATAMRPADASGPLAGPPPTAPTPRLLCP